MFLNILALDSFQVSKDFCTGFRVKFVHIFDLGLNHFLVQVLGRHLKTQNLNPNQNPAETNIFRFGFEVELFNFIKLGFS